MIDTRTPQSPGWWFKRLHDRLVEKRPGYDLLESYVNGTNGIPIAATKATRQAYQRLMRMARTNFAELVVEAVRERINVTGFRTGGDSDDLGDQEAWRIWQGNSLDADSMLVHRPALTMGESYVIVGGVDDETGVPLITPEDPRQTIAEYDPARRRKAIAGLKVFISDDSEQAYLYLPGYVIRAQRGISAGSGVGEWEWASDPQPLPYPVVPVVRFAPKPGLSCGEFEPHLGVLDRINYTVLSRMEVATLQAFRQRAVKGVPVKDETGQDINYDDIFAADPGALWLLPATAEMWESGQVDLGPIRQAIRDDVQDLAAVTRTPLFYLSPDAANGSAEGASLAREGLVFKTGDRLVQFGESWERVMSLAFQFAGDQQRAAAADMEVLWASPERYSLAERYDAAAKAGAAGVPWRTVMTDVLQFSPQQVDRMEAERATDALLAPVPANATAA